MPFKDPIKAKEYAAAYREKNRHKAAAYSAAWREENKEKVSLDGAAYYLANSIRIKQNVSNYRTNNPEKVNAVNAKWAKENPGFSIIRAANRRAIIRESGGKLSKGLTVKLFALQKGKCACCGKPLGRDYHLDHRMPLALGGPNTDDNMQLLTKKCNLQKHHKHPVDFMQSRGFLL